MTVKAELSGGASRWRIVGWGGGAGLLLLPLVGMQVSDEVRWTASDFIFAAALIGGVGVAWELAVRSTRNRAYRGGAAVALAAGFVTVWVNLAVGIIGSEDESANLMFFGVVAFGLVGALLARFRAGGMARAMLAAALAQVAASAVALAMGAGYDGLLALCMAAPWLAAAALFRHAAREGEAGAA